MYINSDWTDLLRFLESRNVSYLVIGGYAVTQYAEPRFTKDLSAFGETPEEARHEVQIAKAAWLEAAQASGKTIPLPFFKTNRTKI